MRILLIAHNVRYGDGQGRINLEIVRRALSRGYPVRIVGVEIDKAVEEQGAICERLTVRRRPILARIVQFARAADHRIDQARSQQQPPMIVANGFTLTRPHDLNLCQFVHAAWLRNRASRATRGIVDWAYQQLYTRYNASRERLAYAAARHIVAPSHRTAAELQDIGVPRQKIEVIPNGVDMDEFKPGPSDRPALGLPPDVPLLLFTGDLRTNRKGLRWVLAAVAKLPQVHLAVVGRADGSPFPAYAAELGITPRVHFLGFRRDVAAIMRACDLFVFPSAYEPFGMVVTEALSSGVPVVTSAATGASELLTPGCGTVLGDPADVDAIARAIQHWLATPGRAAVECRQAVVNHTWACMADAYLDRLAIMAGEAELAEPAAGGAR